MAPRPPRIDRTAFGVSVGLIVLVCAPLALAPQAGGALVVQAYESLTERFGLIYQWTTLAVTVFLVWLAFSHHGKRRLGPEDSRPDFSIFSWMAMLFCAGIGAGLLYWSTIEWVTYLDKPPFELAPNSTEAVEWAATYGIFHWGISAWALYCFPAVAIAIPYYRQHAPVLRLSTGLHALIGRDGYDRPPARVVDLLFILALVGGTGTSLGLGTPMVAACISEVLGIEQTFGLQVTILLVCVTLFAASVYLGLERGIKPLSDGSILAAIVLLAFILIVGPTNFLLRTGTNSIGLMLENFVRLNTWTDPVARTGFIEDMTVFYWAWWIAYGPFMGLFVTRISRGRTVRQLILGMLVLGTLGCALFYAVLGNYSMHLDLSGALPVRDIAAQAGSETAIAQSIGFLPLGTLVLTVFALVAIVFIATTYDSASYCLAASATRNLPEGTHPARWHRLFWAFAVGILPVTLMFIGQEGGNDQLRVIQSATLVVSLPLLVVGALMAVSLMRSLRETEREAESEPG